jgi:epoxyqueuosine reductase
MAARLGGWAFGCDDCQTVCPWNREVPPSADPELLPREGQALLSVGELLSLTEAEYARRFYGTSIARARFDGLVRNAALLAGASGEARWAPLLRPLLESPHEGVRAAARWAVRRVGASEEE